MDQLKKEFSYSITEASKVTGINRKTIERRAKKSSQEKDGRNYVLTGEWLINTFDLVQNIDKIEVSQSVVNESYKPGEVSHKVSHSTTKQPDKELLKLLQREREEREFLAETLSIKEKDIATLKANISEFKLALDREHNEVERLKEKGIEEENLRRDLKIHKVKIENLQDQLKPFQLAPGERIEVMTDSQYSEFETKLKEWHTLQREIQHNAELFAVEKKGLKEQRKYYKTQFEYQKKQSDKMLEIHEKLISTIQEQGKQIIQRQIIEAHDKKVINEDWKTTKDWKQE
jgi:hypothetical protein